MEAEQVFMNPLFFHTGLMVIKPSLEKFNSLLKNLQSTESVSYDGGAFFFGCQSLNSADSFSLQRIKAFSSRSLSMWRVSACLILLEACRKAQSNGQLFLSCVLFWEHFLIVNAAWHWATISTMSTITRPSRGTFTVETPSFASFLSPP